MRSIITSVVDRDSFFEMGRGYGRSQITGLARLNGQTVGVWANDGRFLAGSMTADGAHKARRFMELCETFSFPIVSLVDEPGFMIGSQAERDATIRHGASAVLTAALTTVPWVSVMIRRSFGVAQAAHYGPDGYVIACGRQPKVGRCRWRAGWLWPSGARLQRHPTLMPGDANWRNNWRPSSRPFLEPRPWVFTISSTHARRAPNCAAGWIVCSRYCHRFWVRQLFLSGHSYFGGVFA